MEDIKDILDKITMSDYHRLRKHFLRVDNYYIDKLSSQFERIEKLLTDKK